MRPFEFPTTVSVSVPLFIHPLSLSGTTIVLLSIYIFRSRSSFSLPSSSLPRASSPYCCRHPLARAHHPFLARSYASRSYIYLSVSRILCSPFPFFVSPVCRPVHRLARASIEPAEHRPILHLNLVNLPELANELRAWCLILAHEHGRRYTASNASGEGTRVQSFTKILLLMIAKRNFQNLLHRKCINIVDILEIIKYTILLCPI